MLKILPILVLRYSQFLHPDLLRENDAFHNGLRPGRTARNVDVNLHQLAERAGDGIAVTEHTAGNGADADSNGDLGFRDFVPHSNNIITHLYCDRARDQNNVSLTWRTGIKTAEAFDVVARNKRRRGKFDIAAIAGARVNAEQPGRTD